MSDRRNLLILSTTFFPDPVPASIRLTQWCRFLPDLGWKPTVVCRHFGYDLSPAALAAHVHPEVDVHHIGPRLDHPGRDHPGPSGILGHVMDHLDRWIIPDPSARFWISMTGAVEFLAKQFSPEAILTTSPSLSTHIPAQILSRKYDLPWIADFQEAHSFDARFQPLGAARVMQASHRKFEEHIYNAATAITCAIPLHARWISRTFPGNRRKIRIIPQGFTPDLRDGTIHPDSAPAGQKSVRVLDQIDAAALHLLVEAIAALNESGLDVNLTLVGPKPRDAKSIARRLGDKLLLYGPARQPEALAQIRGADVLVGGPMSDRPNTFPASTRLVEFAAAGKPVVLIDPSVPDRQFARQIKAFNILHRPSAPQLAQALRSAMDGPAPVIDEDALGQFDARLHAQEIAQLLDEITV